MEATSKRTRLAPPPQAASVASISAVFGCDDLLREILLCLDSPIYLVLAAAVSRRWHRRAADTAFLRRFRALHPPRPLGVYLRVGESQGLRFVPLPHGPELAAVVRRRGGLDLGDNNGYMGDSRNGRLVYAERTYVVCCPLHPERRGASLPLPPTPADLGNADIGLYSREILFRENDGEGMLSVVMRYERKAWVHFSEFQAGAWDEGRYSSLLELPGHWMRCKKRALLAGGKLYMICMAEYILGLDLASGSASCIKLPDRVQYEYDANIGLSRAEGSGFYLIHVKGLQLCVWLYTTGCSSAGPWELVDTICLRHAFCRQTDSTWPSQDDDDDEVVHVAAVGDKADFVFLWIKRKVFYMRISSRTVEKVYETMFGPGSYFGIYPLMMPWPPTFPALNGRHDQDQ
ncbi:uncharacterized protein C2845_PM11G17000 [Panicum miliaceum]|uniref:F-box protein AT5G49610-like beta-propeller domain-containing protein n=1 Tax=Panicum miliaceum TaxID=4540 RepID=A0A3L6RNS4_PANMI|nr:uncharacterized protein C2845_PM11G17000 [Panicum miliaceum]